MITARVSAIASSAPSAAGIRPLNTYDDLGPLPKEIEGVASRPGWHVLSNGLPVQVAHRVTELDLERSLWDMEDWTWVAIFVRVEQASRAPQPGDVWTQILTLPTEDCEGLSGVFSSEGNDGESPLCQQAGTTLRTMEEESAWS